MKIRVKFQPKGKVVSVLNGDNILQAGLKNRIYIKSRCGGKGSCTACKIQVVTDDPLISSPSPQEIRMIKEEDIAQGYRLACQTKVYGPIEVSIPGDSWKSAVKKQLEGLNEEERIDE